LRTIRKIQDSRFIRWDPACATVTRSFDYIKEPHILANFFWCYAHLNHSQRGYDTSVSPASPKDLQQIQHVENRLRDENTNHREFCIIMVPDRDDPKGETPFIISCPPEYTARSPFGRAIRPMEKEGEIYVLLESNGASNIAPFGKGNDVRRHMTLTHTLRIEKWACWSRDMVPLSQYRMSLDIVALHLAWFKSSREFVSAIPDALHRGISAGNFSITCEGKGLLIDWNLSIKIIDSETGKKLSSARQPDRTVSAYFFAVDPSLTISSGNVAVYVSCASS
jgi:hypothetical protein